MSGYIGSCNGKHSQHSAQMLHIQSQYSEKNNRQKQQIDKHTKLLISIIDQFNNTQQTNQKHGLFENYISGEINLAVDSDLSEESDPNKVDESSNKLEILTNNNSTDSLSDNKSTDSLSDNKSSISEYGSKKRFPTRTEQCPESPPYKKPRIDFPVTQDPIPESSAENTTTTPTENCSDREDNNLSPESLGSSVSIVDNSIFETNVAQNIDPNNSQFEAENYIEAERQANIVIITSEIYQRHVTSPKNKQGKADEHQESPRRITEIENALKQAGLMSEENSRQPRKATDNEIQLCHQDDYLLALDEQITAFGKSKRCTSSFKPKKEHLTELFLSEIDLNISPGTKEASYYAVGAPLTAVDLMIKTANEINRAYCIVRPPGHHAHAKTGSGFCVFNNVAITAKYALNNGINRVLIVDWDVHHGDGTQELIQHDKNIFYFSTHSDTSNGFFPGPHWGQVEANSENILNCPIDPRKVNPREAVKEAFKSLVLKMNDFKPELVLISCGFDAHKEEQDIGPGGLQLEDEDFVEMTQTCVQIANQYSNGRIISVLEGGYNLKTIARLSVAHVAALMK